MIVFLLLSGFAYVWVPDAATGRTLMQIDGARVLYNSAAIGMGTSMLASMFIGLFGFYVVSNAVRRDVNSRCGYVIASTTMRTGEYIVGKFLGNVVFLTTFIAGYMAASMAMLLVRGEAPLEPLIFMKQYAIVTPSTIVFISVAAIVFESIPWLSGRFGDVFYFFVYAASLGIVASSMEHGRRRGAALLRLQRFRLPDGAAPRDVSHDSRCRSGRRVSIPPRAPITIAGLNLGRRRLGHAPRLDDRADSVPSARARLLPSLRSRPHPRRRRERKARLDAQLQRAREAVRPPARRDSRCAARR